MEQGPRKIIIIESHGTGTQEDNNIESHGTGTQEDNNNHMEQGPRKIESHGTGTQEDNNNYRITWNRDPGR